MGVRREPHTGGAPSTARAADGDAAARETPDADLLARSRDGDRAAFGALVERHHGTLTAILRQRAGRDAPVEDFVQDVFARALVHVTTFRGDACFLTWATTIGTNLALDWRRRETVRRRTSDSAASPDDVPCTAGERARAAVDEADDVRRAREALGTLPERMRLAITMRVVEGLDYETVAERLAAPLPAVRQWVSRGLRRLRETMEDGHGRV